MLIFIFFFIFSTGERPPDRHARLDLNVADPSVIALPLSGLQLTFKSTKKKKKRKITHTLALSSWQLGEVCPHCCTRPTDKTLGIHNTEI